LTVGNDIVMATSAVLHCLTSCYLYRLRLRRLCRWLRWATSYRTDTGRAEAY